jgi:hypothetical protein
MRADYDTPEWHGDRDALLAGIIQDDEALKFLHVVGTIAEIWDDLIDRDKPVTNAQINRAFWLATIGLQTNPFYQRHGAMLMPVMAAGMNAFMDSAPMEQGDAQDRATAYGLRDFYLELVSMVIYIARGFEAMREHSATVRRFLMESHESFAEYFKDTEQ